MYIVSLINLKVSVSPPGISPCAANVIVWSAGLPPFGVIAPGNGIYRNINILSLDNATKFLDITPLPNLVTLDSVQGEIPGGETETFRFIKDTIYIRSLANDGWIEYRVAERSFTEN